MSKTKQRKTQAYSDGFKDGLLRDGYRWSRHPQLRSYDKGYSDGVERRWQIANERTFWPWLRSVVKKIIFKRKSK